MAGGHEFCQCALALQTRGQPNQGIFNLVIACGQFQSRSDHINIDLRKPKSLLYYLSFFGLLLARPPPICIKCASCNSEEVDEEGIELTFSLITLRFRQPFPNPPQQ